MPLLEITCNTTIADEAGLASQASTFTAGMLGKPESYVMVKVHSSQTLIFGGSNEPVAHVKLKSLGLPENRTAEYSEKICDFIGSALNIDSSRIYIEFSSPERHMWGWDSRTF
jgi:phenylpyruvate tautomerase PptA (4-oxalocrotonate tautomerase family)